MNLVINITGHEIRGDRAHRRCTRGHPLKSVHQRDTSHELRHKKRGTQCHRIRALTKMVPLWEAATSLENHALAATDYTAFISASGSHGGISSLSDGVMMPKRVFPPFLTQGAVFTFFESYLYFSRLFII